MALGGFENGGEDDATSRSEVHLARVELCTSDVGLSTVSLLVVSREEG